jgi:hypothetical protein
VENRIQRRILFLLLVLAGLRGILYLAVMPPWQHYDEPTHFEYVRLIAERGRLPHPEDHDLEMRYEIAASMQAHNFWQGIVPPTLDFWSNVPPWIGISELEHPPLYYALLSLPQRLAAYQSVETQLYLARLGSVVLYVVTVAATWGLAREALNGKRWLPLAAGTFVAFLPPFTDLMSAVNNDAGAVAVTTLFFWSTARLLRRGPSPARIGAVLALAGTCLFTKNTAGLVAGVVLGTLIIVHVPRPARRWLWAALALLVPLLLALTFTLGQDAAYWYDETGGTGGSRAEAELAHLPPDGNGTTPQPPFGRHVLTLSSGEGLPAGNSYLPVISQELPPSQGRRLGGEVVTLAAWLRAPRQQKATADLCLYDGTATHCSPVELQAGWQFHAFTETIAAGTPSVAVGIRLPGAEQATGPIQADGLVLVRGEMPIQEQPVFDDATASSGQWGGQRFENLLRNASAEKSWPSLRPWAGTLSPYRLEVAQVFHSLWDWQRTAWVYGLELSNLFTSFWGRFGWNHLALPDLYFVLPGLVTLLALVGTGLSLIRGLRGRGAGPAWQRRTWLVLGLALLVGWVGTLLRIHPVFLVKGGLFWPVARYAGVVIAPTTLVLCAGLARIVPRRWAGPAAYAGLLSLILLDAAALGLVILPYYYS